MRSTARALVIRDRKILLVTGHGAGFYWTPGGGIEAGEQSSQALKREVREELGVDVVSLAAYLAYDYKDQRVENFLVELTGDVSPNSEVTDVIWYSTKSSAKVSDGFRDMVLPRLLEDNLID